MSDAGNETTIIEPDDQTGRRRMFRPRDPLLAFLVLAILAILVWREWRLADESELKQEAQSTAVGLAAQVQAECDDPEVGVALAICQQAEEIVEDPANPPAPPMPEPGEPGEPGADAPPPSDAQVARVLRPLVQPAVNEWFRSNPPDIAAAGEPVPGPAGPEGPAGPVGPEGPQGPAGPTGPAATFTCPGGREPITFTFKGTASIGLPKGTYLICPA